MKIYTKTGDRGETGLIGGVRVSKDHPRIEAYGTVDELNSVIGVALSQSETLKKKAPEVIATLGRIQGELFQLGAELASPDAAKIPKGMALLGAHEIEAFEGEIDKMEASLKPLQTFILPSGCPLSAHLHLARTVCRRAERQVLSLHHSQPVRGEVIQYLNRVADWFFVAARYCNWVSKVQDTPWIAPTPRGSSV